MHERIEANLCALYVNTHTHENKNLQENINLGIENISNKATNTKTHKLLSIPNFLIKPLLLQSEPMSED